MMIPFGLQARSRLAIVSAAAPAYETRFRSWA